MKTILATWKTTSAGLASIFTALATIAHAISQGNLLGPETQTAIAALVAGIGLIAAGDAGAPPATPPK